MDIHHAISALRATSLWLATIDVLVVAYIIYRLLVLVHGSRAFQILGGLLTLLAALYISDRIHLDTLNWLLQKVVPLGPVAIVILFYPELRHALEEFGPRLWSRGVNIRTGEDLDTTLGNVVAAIMRMAATHTGALLVFERQTGLDDIIATGIPIDAELSGPLLDTIFFKGTALHDGAAVVRGNRIAAAACTLPLTDRPTVDSHVHTRHKAAYGMAENSDAVIVVVSEETGAVSVVCGTKMQRASSADDLRKKLAAQLQVPESGVSRIRATVRDHVAGSR